MKMKFLGVHDIDSLSSRCISFLIDDRVVLDAGGLTSGLSLEAQLLIEAVFLTHHHYDHVRDIPALALYFRHNGLSFDLYGTRPTYEALASHFFDGVLYPKFLETPAGNPTVRFTIVESGKEIAVQGYRVLPVSVNHAVPTVGYQLTSPDGKSIFYTGDTGPGLAGAWQAVSPDLLVTEVTVSNRHADQTVGPKHLTPAALKNELLEFRKLKGYLPETVVVHMEPEDEPEIREEIASLGVELGMTIGLAREGMEINV